MKNNELFNNFINNNDYSLESIVDFEDSILMNHKQLIRKTFKQLNTAIGQIEEDNLDYISNLSLKYVDLLCVLCDLVEFNEDEVLINRNRIKKSREAILANANKYNNEILLEAANKLDEIVLDKNINVEDLIKFIKELINKNEDIDIIKRLLNTNKGAIILNGNELFDYTFNFVYNSLKNNNVSIYYYIALLKIFYSTTIDKNKYLKLLDSLDINNTLSKELRMIILGNKRSLTPEEILDKYDIITDLKGSGIYVPKEISSNEYIFTIDEKTTRLKDDGLSFKRDGNKLIVGIHIPDAGSLIKPNSIEDLQAFKNYKCTYLPHSSTRLFDFNIENNISLNTGENRKVITLYVVFNGNYDVVDYYLKEEIISVSKKLSYEQTDKILDNIIKLDISRDIFDLYSIACILELRNKRKKEYWEKRNKQNHQTNHIFRTSNKIVSEFMTLYNYLVPMIMADKGIPYTYRTQEPAYFHDLAKKLNISLDETSQKLIDDIFLTSKYSTIPLYHNGIDLKMYSHSSCPGRRYPDLYNQYLMHNFYFKDINFDFDYDDHIKYIEYFNQRNMELSLMQGEYVRSLKIQN